MATQALTPAAPASLYDLESNFHALLESEDFVAPEQEQEYRLALAKAMTESVEKRNRIYQFLRIIQLSSDNCAEEIKRLQTRKKMYANAKDRMYAYLKVVIESLGLDEKGKHRSLKCDFCTYSLRSVPDRVEITDAEQIPDEFKEMGITMPLLRWNGIVESLNEEGRKAVDSTGIVTSVNEAKVGAAIKAGKSVPGADMRGGEKALQVR